jgi:hypothetical protein
MNRFFQPFLAGACRFEVPASRKRKRVTLFFATAFALRHSCLMHSLAKKAMRAIIAAVGFLIAFSGALPPLIAQRLSDIKR